MKVCYSIGWLNQAEGLPFNFVREPGQHTLPRASHAMVGYKGSTNIGYSHFQENSDISGYMEEPTAQHHLPVQQPYYQPFSQQPDYRDHMAHHNLPFYRRPDLPLDPYNPYPQDRTQLDFSVFPRPQILRPTHQSHHPFDLRPSAPHISPVHFALPPNYLPTARLPAHNIKQKVHHIPQELQQPPILKPSVIRKKVSAQPQYQISRPAYPSSKSSTSQDSTVCLM